MKEEVKKYISQAEAARLRGVSRQAIFILIQRNRLSTVKVEGRTLLLRSEVKAFVAGPPWSLSKKESSTSAKPKKK